MMSGLCFISDLLSLPSPIFSRSRVTLAVLALSAGLAGCGGTTTDSTRDETVQKDTAESKASACRTRLESALRRLTPRTVADLDRQDKIVGGLNAWVASCAGDDIRGSVVSEANLAFLDSAAQRIASAPRFTATDAAFIRDSLILNRIAQRLSSSSKASEPLSEAQQILAVFRWVINNISLEKRDEPGEARAPKTLLTTLLTGRGSAESRAWIFASLLRQLERDAVLVLPSDATDDSQFLTAACLEDRILLFDVRLGLPVSTESDTSLLVDEPAGVEFFQANAGWQNPQVRIIAQTSVLCPRMLVLQEQLPIEFSAGIYEELAGGTSEIRPLIERVAAAAPDVFKPTEFTLWKWPNEQVRTTTAQEEAMLRERADLLRAFEAPFERDKLELDTDFGDLLSQPDLTPEQRAQLWAQRATAEYEKMEELTSSNKLFGRPSSRLLKTRLRQLESGRDREIIQQLQKIRVACIDDKVSYAVPQQVDPSGRKSVPLPESIQKVNRQATSDALYWTGICQMDRNEPGTAISTFQSYRRQYPEGDWYYEALMNQALSELRQGRKDAAATTLKEASDEKNPEHARAKALLERMGA